MWCEANPLIIEGPNMDSVMDSRETWKPPDILPKGYADSKAMFNGCMKAFAPSLSLDNDIWGHKSEAGLLRIAIKHLEMI